MIRFDSSSDTYSISKVIGVGGGGSNAVSYMNKQLIKNLDLVICNTDQQALDKSPIPVKLLLGSKLTLGVGAGSRPEVGKNAALESIEIIKELFTNNTKIVFIIAGLGGGTGTGATPVIAKVAKEMGMLTIGIVTFPFGFEGKNKKQLAIEGLKELKDNVDILIVVYCDKLRELYGNLLIGEAFGKADDILTKAIIDLANIIDNQVALGRDVKTLLKHNGLAILAFGHGTGEDRVSESLKNLMHSPFLENVNIRNARNIMIKITSGTNAISEEENRYINNFIQRWVGLDVEIMKGYRVDLELNDEIKITLIATGYELDSNKIDALEKIEDQISLTQESFSIEKFLEKKTNSLSLYFLEDEYKKEEIAEIVSLLSDIYREIGGDKLIIEGFSTYEFSQILEPVEA